MLRERNNNNNKQNDQFLLDIIGDNIRWKSNDSIFFTTQSNWSFYICYLIIELDSSKILYPFFPLSFFLSFPPPLPEQFPLHLKNFHPRKIRNFRPVTTILEITMDRVGN